VIVLLRQKHRTASKFPQRREIGAWMRNSVKEFPCRKFSLPPRSHNKTKKRKRTNQDRLKACKTTSKNVQRERKTIELDDNPFVNKKNRVGHKDLGLTLVITCMHACSKKTQSLHVWNRRTGGPGNKNIAENSSR
jgi:hypothetical protein